jgi:hypothetical protein
VHPSRSHPGRNSCGPWCVDCLAPGDSWVHLRVCLNCGYVGCCDSSEQARIRACQYEGVTPIVQSFEPEEDWFWCHIDEVAFFMDDAPRLSYVPG